VRCSRGLVVYGNRHFNIAGYGVGFGKDFTTDLRNDTSGDYQSLLLALASGNRDPTYLVNMVQAQSDAADLYKVCVCVRAIGFEFLLII
jgi:hypothetical protein